MNIGFFLASDWRDPKGGSGIHGYQVTSQLVGRGHTVSVFGESRCASHAVRYARNELGRFLDDVDLLYVRPHPSFRTDRFSMLKPLFARDLPLFWEINAPLQELLVQGRSQVEVERSLRRARRLARFVDGAICNTEPLRDYAREQLGIEAAWVVPLGSDPGHFSPAARCEELYEEHGGSFTVIWAGTAQHPWHAIDRVLEVAGRVAAVAPGLRFVLIGRLAALEAHWRRAGSPRNVVCLGERPYRDMPRYIASADLGLCLYTDHAWSGIGLYRSPLKLFDYMACGLPALATAGGQVSKVIEQGENGVLVGDDCEAIARRILEVAEQPELRRRMGEAARKTVERYYNWERVGADTERVLERLLERRCVSQ